MTALKKSLIGAGLTGFRLTGLHHAVAPLTRGRGAILAFHHVRPSQPRPFAPNLGLEITPDYLDAVLGHLRRRGIRIVPLDEIPSRLASPGPERVAALTFDDGYRDTLDHALPVLERHAAPFTVFVTTGFAERTAPLWWLDLEAAIARAEHLDLTLDGRVRSMPARSLGAKGRAFATLAGRLRRSPPAEVAAVLDALGCDPAQALARVDRLCLDWDGIAQLAAHPLATVGCHTLTHPSLAALDDGDMRHEIARARDIIAERLGRPVRHLAYPYGGVGAAGSREFAAAARLGFMTGVTTRPGVLRRRHLAEATALPRVSVNGLWPRLEMLDVLLSGAPFVVRDLLAGAP